MDGEVKGEFAWEREDIVNTEGVDEGGYVMLRMKILRFALYTPELWLLANDIESFDTHSCE